MSTAIGSGATPGHAWLHRIVVNAALSAVRRRRDIVGEVALVDAGRPDDTRNTNDRLALFAALDELTPRQRAAVVLRYYHDYDYATIARILGMTTNAVGAMLSRALDRLKDELDKPQVAAAGVGR